MEAIHALKESESGKICGKGMVVEGHAYINGEGVLIWDDDQEPVTFSDINGINWQPYPEVKEIRPENPGELWVDGQGTFYHTVRLYDGLHFSGLHESIKIYNRLVLKTWTRLYPPVEDEKEIIV